MFPAKTLSKILREMLQIQNSQSNWRLTSFYVLFAVHVICPTVGLLFDSGYRELNWKILAGFNEGNMLPL